MERAVHQVLESLYKSQLATPLLVAYNPMEQQSVGVRMMRVKAHLRPTHKVSLRIMLVQALEVIMRVEY